MTWLVQVSKLSVAYRRLMSCVDGADKERLGAPWVAVLLLLALLLVIGIVLYIQMSAPLNEPVRRRTGERLRTIGSTVATTGFADVWVAGKSYLKN